MGADWGSKATPIRTFDLMFENAVDLRKKPLLERKKRLKAILPRDKLIAISAHRKGDGTKFFAEAELTWKRRLELPPCPQVQIEDRRTELLDLRDLRSR